MSEEYEIRRSKLIAEVLRKNADTKPKDPITDFLAPGSLILADFPGKHRDGNPRHNWWTTGIKNDWNDITKEYFRACKNAQLNTKNREHRASS